MGFFFVLFPSGDVLCACICICICICLPWPWPPPSDGRLTDGRTGWTDGSGAADLFQGRGEAAAGRCATSIRKAAWPRRAPVAW